MAAAKRKAFLIPCGRGIVRPGSGSSTLASDRDRVDSDHRHQHCPRRAQWSLYVNRFLIVLHGHFRRERRGGRSSESIQTALISDLALFGQQDNYGGFTPCGGLTLSGSIFYGTTWDGPIGTGSGFGTIYTVGVNGTGFSLLHSFYDDNGAHSGGIMPAGTPPSVARRCTTCVTWAATQILEWFSRWELVAPGSRTCTSFAGGTDGAFPFARNSLLLSGSALFGTTYTADWGPNSSDNGQYYGTVFEVGTSGSDIGFYTLSPAAPAMGRTRTEA